jgi:hypothetical protein
MGSTGDPDSGAMAPRSIDEDGEKSTPLSSSQDVIMGSKEEPVDSNGPITAAEADPEYLGGMKLFMAMFSLTFVAFLVLLDVSVVATVSCNYLHPHYYSYHYL